MNSSMILWNEIVPLSRSTEKLNKHTVLGSRDFHIILPVIESKALIKGGSHSYSILYINLSASTSDALPFGKIATKEDYKLTSSCFMYVPNGHNASFSGIRAQCSSK